MADKRHGNYSWRTKKFKFKVKDFDAAADNCPKGPLSRRQRETLFGRLCGKSVPQIAVKLGRCEGTIDKHDAKMRDRLGGGGFAICEERFYRLMRQERDVRMNGSPSDDLLRPPPDDGSTTLPDDLGGEPPDDPDIGEDRA